MPISLISPQRVIFIFTAMRVLFTFLLLVSIGSLWAARTDTVYLYNGDRITGEIKYLRDNKLNFKTDRAGTINIEWPSVKRIYSNSYFDILTTSNERLFGRLLYGDSARSVIIELGSFSVTKNLIDIVTIDPVKSGFLNQLTGTISISASYTKSNKNLQFNGGFDITHRTRKYQNAIKANTVITSNDNQDQTQRTDASYSVRRMFNSPWFVAGALSYQRNTGLNINARYQLFGGGGYYFLLKPGRDFSGTTGISANSEESYEEPITFTQNLEYVAALRFHKFKFRDPQFDIYSSLVTYTSLNVPGRFRYDLEVVFLWEFFSDFKWNVTFYNNFDNKPPGGDGVANDWNLLTGITYTL